MVFVSATEDQTSLVTEKIAVLLKDRRVSLTLSSASARNQFSMSLNTVPQPLVSPPSLQFSFDPPERVVP